MHGGCIGAGVLHDGWYVMGGPRRGRQGGGGWGSFRFAVATSGWREEVHDVTQEASRGDQSMIPSLITLW